MQYIQPSGVYVDGTVGGGGHAEAICKRLTGGGVLVCCDADRDAIECAEERLRGFRERLSFVQANFSELEARVTSLIPGSVSGILLDLGVSSHQLDEPARGFSFRASAPLDMRFGTGGQSAHDVVNGYGADDLERVLRDYGEERAARRTARAIVARDRWTPPGNWCTRWNPRRGRDTSSKRSRVSFRLCASKLTDSLIISPVG